MNMNRTQKLHFCKEDLIDHATDNAQQNSVPKCNKT